MNGAERLEDLRRDAPAAAAALVGCVADNPAQFAVVLSGSYVITRGLGRLVRPNTVGGALMTATASYALCWFLLGQARRRGVLEFKTRDPFTGELVTSAEFDRRLAESAGAFAGKLDPEAPLIDLEAVEREVKRRAASPG